MLIWDHCHPLLPLIGLIFHSTYFIKFVLTEKFYELLNQLSSTFSKIFEKYQEAKSANI